MEILTLTIVQHNAQTRPIVLVTLRANNVLNIYQMANQDVPTIIIRTIQLVCVCLNVPLKWIHTVIILLGNVCQNVQEVLSIHSLIIQL